MNLYHDLLELQQGRCGMCGIHDRDLQIDHDHGSGLVRGLLCRGCNHREGRHGHCGSPLDAQQCLICLWRRTPAVAWLGYTERYEPLAAHWVPAREAAFREQPFRTTLERANEARANVELGLALGREVIDSLYDEDGAA